MLTHSLTHSLTPIVHFHFISRTIPAAPAHRVYISQLVRYHRVCSQYIYFLSRNIVLTQRVTSSLQIFYDCYQEFVDRCEKNDFSNGNRSFAFDVDFVVFYLPHLYLSNTALSYQNMNGLSLASIWIQPFLFPSLAHNVSFWCMLLLPRLGSFSGLCPILHVHLDCPLSIVFSVFSYIGLHMYIDAIFIRLPLWYPQTFLTSCNRVQNRWGHYIWSPTLIPWLSVNS